MTGAPIPDDWDGSTYRCYRVEWPDSEDWRAILLGQISEVAKESYFDENTGNPTVAALAADNGFLQTVPNIWEVGCDSMPTDIPFFQVGQPGITQTVGGVWTSPDFLTYKQSWNNPEWDFAANGHRPIAEENMGLWAYHLVARWINQNEPAEVRFYIPETTFAVASVKSRGHSCQLTFFLEHAIPGGTTVEPQLRRATTTGIESQEDYIFMQGYKIGEIR